MLTATRELIDGVRAARSGSLADGVLAAARTAVIARHGTPEDAHALLDLFLDAPTEYRRAVVLEAVMHVGDHAAARRLATDCLAGGRLKDEVQPEVLYALGFLGFAEVRQVLWDHSRAADYYVQKAAALGLLNLPCDGLEPEIEGAIRGCVGKSLFEEFLPALAAKTGNPELLDTIFDLGRTTASTDCNAGIVYGIALYGEAGRSRFEQLLFDPYWEAYGGGTGTQRWAYHGLRHLGGTLARLAGRARALSDEHPVRVWAALVECWLGDVMSPLRGEVYPREAAADVYRAAFDGPGDSLTRYPELEVDTLRERMADRITADVFHDAS